jgi:hypothetical protein
VDDDTACCSGRYVRVATLAFARLLHQAEAYLDYGTEKSLGTSGCDDTKRGSGEQVCYGALCIGTVGYGRSKHGYLGLAFDMVWHGK